VYQKLDIKMENGVTINSGSELKQNCGAIKTWIKYYEILLFL